MNKADWEYFDENYSPTGLLRECPRCRKVGAVWRRNDNSDDFMVVWPAKPRDAKWEASRSSIDLCSLNDLARPMFGCGHDRRRK